MSHISLIQVVEVPSSCSSRLSFLLFIKVVSLFCDIEKVDIQIVALLAVNSRWDCTYLTAKASPGPGRDFMGFIGTHVSKMKRAGAQHLPHPSCTAGKGHLQRMNHLCSSRLQLQQHRRKALNWSLKTKERTNSVHKETTS